MQTLNREIDFDVTEDREWRKQSACRDTDPDLFFPIGTTGAALDRIRSAKRICKACDSRPKCLEYALMSNQESGVWGGTSEDERRALRKGWLNHQLRTA